LSSKVPPKKREIQRLFFHGKGGSKASIRAEETGKIRRVASIYFRGKRSVSRRQTGEEIKRKKGAPSKEKRKGGTFLLLGRGRGVSGGTKSGGKEVLGKREVAGEKDFPF